MTIAVIQDRPIICHDGDYYSINPVDIEKYLRLCDNLAYCASPSIVSEDKLKSATKIDSNRVSVRLVNKSPLKEMLFPSKHNKEVVVQAISDADVIVIKAPSITIGKLAFDIVRRTNKKYIVEMIGCAWDSFWYHGIKGKIMAYYCETVTKKMCAEAKNVLYVTNEFLQRRYPNSSHTVGCSNVVLPEINEETLNDRLKRIQELPNDSEMKIGTAGAVNVRYKGQQYVIEAIGKLRKKGKAFHYYLAGSGDQTYLKKVAEKNGVSDLVHFMGMVPKAQMKDYYDSLDIYIHSSMAEGLPRVMIEAESRALPSLGARASGTPELLDEDCIFESHDSDSICRVIETFDKEKMMRVARHNFERSHDYLSDILNERRKNFYSKLI